MVGTWIYSVGGSDISAESVFVHSNNADRGIIYSALGKVTLQGILVLTLNYTILFSKTTKKIFFKKLLFINKSDVYFTKNDALY